MTPNATRIVVADTDRTVLELLEIRLEIAGYRVFVSRDANDVIEVIQVARPAALVLDINLNGGGAKGVMETLRRKNLLTFPILLMGRKMTPESLQAVMRLGARACIIKPFSGSDVLERINWMLRSAPPPPPPADPRPVIYLDA
jgi:DNA-binding response OmpR family regulator